MVEIRKSRKPSSGGEPLFSPQDIPPPIVANESAAMVAARKLFAPVAYAPPAREVLRVDAQEAFSGEDPALASDGAGRTRILPDLTRQEPAASAAISLLEEKPRRDQRKATGAGRGGADLSRLAKEKKLASTPKARVSAPRSLSKVLRTNAFGEAPGDLSPPDPGKQIQKNVRLLARRRAGNPAGALGLRAGERWKRRLPPALW